MNFFGQLVDKGFLSVTDRASVEAEIAKKRPLAEVLTEHDVSLENALLAIGKDYGLPVRLLGEPPADQEALAYIPVTSAQHYGFVPLALVDGALEVGIIDPDNIESLDALQFISGQIGVPYKVFLITKEDFDRVIEAYENMSGEVGKALSEYETLAKRAEKHDEETNKRPLMVEEETLNLATAAGLDTAKEDAPVTKIVSTILRYAIDGQSSDIHIEPSATKTRVRFRMDGELHTSLELPGKVHDAVVARIKILSKLRLDEKRKPQDGRFSATAEKRRIDFRVSTFPTEFGEKMEMRILDQSATTATLDTIGLSPEQQGLLQGMLKEPYGILLIAGPTGSGKSTTLFAMLSQMDRDTVNVVSLEDPVEYQIPGVSQSQVRPEIDYTFANGLRAILRQDPDVIMVGEIRDKETAALAVQAALTGHLVLSTIHTNSASGAIPRLVDMGVDPFLIAPTLIGVIGQRLVKKLCPGGGKPAPVSESMKVYLDKQFADLPDQYKKQLPPFTNIYHAGQTAECPTGTRGREGVFEFLVMNKEIEQVLLTEPVEEKVYAAARAGGMLTMREQAIVKALEGQIAFEEVNTLGGGDLFPEASAAAV